MMWTSVIPASFSRAPASSPPKPPPITTTSTSVEQRFALDRLDVGVLDEVGEVAGDLHVLVVAVLAQSLVALGSVLLAQGVRVER